MDIRKALVSARYYNECPKDTMAERLGIPLELYCELEDGALGEKLSALINEVEQIRRREERKEMYQEYISSEALVCKETNLQDTLENPIYSIAFTCLICILAYLVHWVCCR